MVSKKLFLQVSCCLVAVSALFIHDGGASSSNESSGHIDSTEEEAAVADMASVFRRSEELHQDSMDRITKSLTVPKALAVLFQGSFANSSGLQEVASLISNVGAVQTHSNLRRKKQPAGYSGLAGAKKLLNDMIYESLSKYDAEIAKCTDYYSKQCALMEVARGEIASANFVAANSRMLILDAQQNINACEEDIPKTKYALKQHNLKCKAELKKLNARLKIVMGDIAVMTMILKMTDCDKKTFSQIGQFAMCEDQCKRSFLVFNHNGLQEQVDKLQTTVAQSLISSTFADLFEGIKSLEDYEQQPIVNKTKFNNPPVPRTKVPGNPCNDPYQGAPSPEDKRAAKCTIKKSPQCFKLQERFLLIQAGIADERDQLMADIESVTAECAVTRKTLETAIENDESLLDASQTKLAFATEKEASAGEKARVVAKQNEEYNSDLVKQMKKCSANYINFETELCALKKIRGELYKMKGAGHPGFFQDCEVSKWGPEACTKKCAGGEQKLIRSVLTHPNGGAKCLPLAAMASCNNAPCPVDCVLDAWTGWSKCSAKCGGGVTQRLRDVKTAMKHGGKPCSTRKQTTACNIKACEKDCELSEWTVWTTCSKDCDGGTRKRTKFVWDPAEGSGKCPGIWTPKRLQYKPCNQKRCKTYKAQPLQCNRTFDVVLMIDGCPKGGKDSWDAQIAAATTFVDSFTPKNKPKTEVAVIEYCGPRTWSGVSKCTGKSTKKVDIEKTCKVKVVSHFTNDMKKTKSLINGLSMQKGMKLMALGLLAAKAELTLGRKTAQSIVVGFIDGPPLSVRKTTAAAKALRKGSRLLLVALIKFSPLKVLKTLVTRRWQENLVKVDGGKALSKNTNRYVTRVIANICPKDDPKLDFGGELYLGDMGHMGQLI